MKDLFQRHPILAPVALFSGACCLIVSMYQAGQFLHSLGSVWSRPSVMYLMTFCLITSGVVIAMLLNSGARRTAVALGLAWVVVLMIETFSIGTSATALRETIARVEEKQKSESPEYVIKRNQLIRAENRIHTVQAEIDALPANYHGMRQKRAPEITELEKKIDTLSKELSAVEGSTVGTAFDDLQETTGIKPFYLLLLAAFLLTAIPQVFILLLGNPNGGSTASTKFGAKTGPKPSGSPQAHGSPTQFSKPKG